DRLGTSRPFLRECPARARSRSPATGGRPARDDLEADTRGPTPIALATRRFHGRQGRASAGTRGQTSKWPSRGTKRLSESPNSASCVPVALSGSDSGLRLEATASTTDGVARAGTGGRPWARGALAEHPSSRVHWPFRGAHG